MSVMEVNSLVTRELFPGVRRLISSRRFTPQCQSCASTATVSVGIELLFICCWSLSFWRLVPSLLRGYALNFLGTIGWVFPLLARRSIVYRLFSLHSQHFSPISTSYTDFAVLGAEPVDVVQVYSRGKTRKERWQQQTLWSSQPQALFSSQHWVCV